MSFFTNVFGSDTSVFSPYVFGLMVLMWVIIAIMCGGIIYLLSDIMKQENDLILHNVQVRDFMGIRSSNPQNTASSSGIFTEQNKETATFQHFSTLPPSYAYVIENDPKMLAIEMEHPPSYSDCIGAKL